MIVQVAFEPYEETAGLRLQWEPSAEIAVSLSDNEVLVSANRAGLRTLASFLLTLAQDGVPSGSHLHLGPASGLEDDSEELILQLLGP